MCQIHKATADSNHAESGAETTCQPDLKGRDRPNLAAVSRHAGGNAQRKGSNGRPRTSSGADISIRISCWCMCTQNSCSPNSWSGESSAITREIKPTANQSIGHTDGFRLPALRSIFVAPRTYRPAATNNGMTTKGGHVHSYASAPPLCVRDHAGVAVAVATKDSTASWQRVKDISFTRTKNPERDRHSNEHEGKGQA